MRLVIRSKKLIVATVNTYHFGRNNNNDQFDLLYRRLIFFASTWRGFFYVFSICRDDLAMSQIDFLANKNFL